MLLPAPVPILPLASPAMVQAQEWRREGVTIRYQTVTIEMVPVEGAAPAPRLIFEGEVVVESGVTKVFADRVTVDEATRTASAEGGVRVEDPDAQIEAAAATFNWETQTGVARDARLRAATVTLSAEEIAFEPGLQTATNATFYLARHSQPPVFITARSIRVRAGEVVTADAVSLNLYGLNLGPYPRLSFRLDDRGETLKLPEIAYKDGKFGLEWSGAFLVSQRGLFTFSSVARPNEPTRGQARLDFDLTRSGAGQFGRRNAFGERGEDGYFDQIMVDSPEEETASFRTERFTIGVGSSLNEASVARPLDENRITRPWFVEAYRHQPLGPFATRASVGVEQVRPRPDAPFVERGVAQFSALAPRYDFGGLSSHLRIDLFGTAGRQSYGWARVEAGFFARPMDGLTLGVARLFSATSGTPDFAIDGLYSRSAWHFRADYERGPYTLRYLAKYDEGLGGFYDYEYEAALVADVWEPFVMYRRFPSSFQFGVRLRLDEFRDILRRRTAR